MYIEGLYIVRKEIHIFDIHIREIIINLLYWLRGRWTQFGSVGIN